MIISYNDNYIYVNYCNNDYRLNVCKLENCGYNSMDKIHDLLSTMCAVHMEFNKLSD